MSANNVSAPRQSTNKNGTRRSEQRRIGLTIQDIAPASDFHLARKEPPFVSILATQDDFCPGRQDIPMEGRIEIRRCCTEVAQENIW